MVVLRLWGPVPESPWRDGLRRWAAWFRRQNHIDDSRGTVRLNVTPLAVVNGYGAYGALAAAWYPWGETTDGA